MKNIVAAQKTEISKLDTIVSEVIAEIASKYISGIRPWISEHRPDLSDKLTKAEDKVNLAWLEILRDTSQIKAFLEALRNYRQVNLEVIAEYEKFF